MQESMAGNPGNVFSETAMNGKGSAADSPSFDNSKFPGIPEVPDCVAVFGIHPLGSRHRLGIV